MAVHESFAEITSLLERDCIINATVQEVFRRLEENCKSQEEIRGIDGIDRIPDESLIALDCIFGETFIKALELVDTRSIKFYHTTPKTLGIFQVDGRLDNSYIVFPHINYCSCYAYKYQVATGSLLTCKHVLASKIAKILGKVELVGVTQSEFYNLLLVASGINDVCLLCQTVDGLTIYIGRMCTGFLLIKMNKREDWPDQNRYMEPCMYPQPEIPGGFPQPNNWVHVPPQTMPWGLPSNSHPPVVRFTAGDFTTHHHPVKRKMNIEFEMRPPKQLVTEEKMAAHMSNLHISDVELPCLNAEDDAMDTDRLPKLIVCDEVKNLKSEPIIPESLLNKIERPKMAVVLWQPPGNDLVSKITELQKENEKRNEKEEKDENAMIIENNNVDNTFRPIDPVPMHATPQNHFLQPTPQFHGYFPFS